MGHRKDYRRLLTRFRSRVVRRGRSRKRKRIDMADPAFEIDSPDAAQWFQSLLNNYYVKSGLTKTLSWTRRASLRASSASICLIINGYVP